MSGIMFSDGEVWLGSGVVDFYLTDEDKRACVHCAGLIRAEGGDCVAIEPEEAHTNTALGWACVGVDDGCEVRRCDESSELTCSLTFGGDQ